MHVQTHVKCAHTDIEHTLDKENKLMPVALAHMLELSVSDWGHWEDEYTDAYKPSCRNSSQTSHTPGILYGFALILFL